jgi:transcription initiation factor IIF auxiliary subunit
MSSLEFSTYSRYRGKVNDVDRYAWCVFVNEPLTILNGIREVEYILHPSFSDPVRTISDCSHCFSLISDAWGTFPIKIRVMYRNGEIGRQEYYLRLKSDAWPLGPKLEQFDDASARLIYQAMLETNYEWRTLHKFTQVSARSERDVLSILAATGERRHVRKHQLRTPRGEELWGATCRIGLLPEPH